MARVPTMVVQNQAGEALRINVCDLAHFQAQGYQPLVEPAPVRESRRAETPGPIPTKRTAKPQEG